jgi:hypothetical protein
MNPYIEKFLWMLVPLLFSAVGYMWTSVQQLQDKVQDLESKMSLVVSKDNKVIPSLEAELAREKLRQDVNKFAADNRERIIIIEQQLKNKK